MKEKLKDKIAGLVEGKLTSGEIEELIAFFRETVKEGLDRDDESFFRNMAYEMTGNVKELALMIIHFRRDLKSIIHPELTDIATKFIPQATNQLKGIMDTTEMAAHRIMDNLENMQADIEKMKKAFSSLKEGTLMLSNGHKEVDRNTVETISPLIDQMESEMENSISLISDSFVQMSFQDLTGQKIKRIIKLVSEIEEMTKKMIISFGIRLTEKERNPDISMDELARAVAEKGSELAGPQREGGGLDQSGIDDLLAAL